MKVLFQERGTVSENGKGQGYYKVIREMCGVKNLVMICLKKLFKYWDHLVIKGQVSEQGGTYASPPPKYVCQNYIVM